MDKSALQSRDYRLRAITHVEAHENDADVTLDRGFGDAQIRGNLFVAFAADDEIEHLALARAQVGIGNA